MNEKMIFHVLVVSAASLLIIYAVNKTSLGRKIFFVSAK